MAFLPEIGGTHFFPSAVGLTFCWSRYANRSKYSASLINSATFAGIADSDTGAVGADQIALTIAYK